MKLNLENTYEIVNPDLSFETKKLWEMLKSDKTIIYFYPKDNTPGCSMEAKDFTCLAWEFKKLGIDIIWVSKDSIESHIKFITNLALWIPFISDKDLVLHKELWVYGEKNNYGKIVMWVIRSTFLVVQNGEILKEWRNVKATGHAAKVLREIV